jgi:hypothetical protein
MFPQVKYGTMANLAVFIIFAEVQLMAENNRAGVFKGKGYILVIGRTCHDSSK